MAKLTKTKNDPELTGLKDWARDTGRTLAMARKLRSQGAAEWAEWWAHRQADLVREMQGGNTAAPDELEDVLRRAYETEKITARLLTEAVELGSDPDTVGRAAKNHNDAAMRILQLRTAYDAFLLARRDVLPWSEVQRSVARCLGPLRSALQSMPRTLAASISPADPGPTEVALTQWVDDLRNEIETAVGMVDRGGEK